MVNICTGSCWGCGGRAALGPSTGGVEVGPRPSPCWCGSDIARFSMKAIDGKPAETTASLVLNFPGFDNYVQRKQAACM